MDKNTTDSKGSTTISPNLKSRNSTLVSSESPNIEFYTKNHVTGQRVKLYSTIKSIMGKSAKDLKI